jgi:hypothetical protein
MNYFAPEVVHIQRKDGKVHIGCDVYIGRRQYQGGWNLPDSEWRNPYPPKEYGMDESLRLYRIHLTKEITNNPVKWFVYMINIVNKGRPLTIGCWCKRKGDGRCHGDVVREFCIKMITYL